MEIRSSSSVGVLWSTKGRTSGWGGDTFPIIGDILTSFGLVQQWFAPSLTPRHCWVGSFLHRLTCAVVLEVLWSLSPAKSFRIPNKMGCGESCQRNVYSAVLCWPWPKLVAKRIYMQLQLVLRVRFANRVEKYHVDCVEWGGWANLAWAQLCAFDIGAWL